MALLSSAGSASEPALPPSPSTPPSFPRSLILLSHTHSLHLSSSLLYPSSLSLGIRDMLWRRGTWGLRRAKEHYKRDHVNTHLTVFVLSGGKWMQDISSMAPANATVFPPFKSSKSWQAHIRQHCTYSKLGSVSFSYDPALG